MFVRNAVCAVALAVAASGSAQASSSNAVTTIDEPGVWTLSRLGLPGAQDVPLIGRSATSGLPIGEVRVPYRLPAGARQGPRRWYLARVHAAVTFSREGGAGTAYLSAATNGRAASQAKFELPPGGGPLRYSTVDLVEGLRERSTSGRTVDLRNENFLQDRGVRGGNGMLTFSVDQIGGAARVESVRILPDSGLAVSRAGPAPLALTARATRGHARVGSTFTVRATVRNPGRRTARQLSIAARVVGSGARLQGTNGRDIASLLPGRRATTTFTFRARRPGRTRVIVEADSASASKAAGVTVAID